ncbi:CAP domain-containing protein [Ferrovibrio sp.]|uniref:CAP domain-containing protein n=1 Tax=Ferrovibrio sp. TaxID=1917215 RepID=UPI002622C46C|nr:CAP domain-containing protein [Ferrovibrio sp.]
MRLAAVLLVMLLLGRPAAAMDPVWQSELLHAVNTARAAHGLAPLAWNGRLARAAAAHAADLQSCGRIAHEGCDGSDLARRLNRIGYGFRMAAENLAVCACDADGVVRLWLGSDGHRRNLLNPNVTELGADTRADPTDLRRALWVLVLGRE